MNDLAAARGIIIGLLWGVAFWTIFAACLAVIYFNVRA